MSSLEFRPIPQSSDFDAAFTHVDRLFASHDDLTVVTHGESAMSLVDDEALRQNRALSSYSTFFIPYESDKNDPNVYDPAHAFARGFSLAFPVNDILYDGAYNFDDYFSSLNQWMVSHNTELIQDDQQWFEANASFVKLYGEGGLKLFGRASQGIIETWGDRLYASPTLSRVFSLGCGALAMSGVIHQRSVNEYAIRTSDFAEKLNQDLEALLAKKDRDE
jgi:hypothetical protein